MNWGVLSHRYGVPCSVLMLAQPTEAFIPHPLLTCPAALNAGVGGQSPLLPRHMGGGRSSPSSLWHLLSSNALSRACPRAMREASAPTLFLSPLEGLQRVTQFAGMGNAVVAAGNPVLLLITYSLSPQLVQPSVPRVHVDSGRGCSQQLRGPKQSK